jgi:anthraniloyl-CoA monooxygenase
LKIVSIGGGPAGLYLAILMKKADPRHDVTVVERNRADDTFGFGVVFSDATLQGFGDADPATYAAITRSFAHWDDIDIHYKGEVVTSTGHGFSGLSRQVLLNILQDRARELGVRLEYQTDVTDIEPYRSADLVLAADGVNSFIRQRYAEHFQPQIDWGRNKFVWLGTTRPFPAFTFYLKEGQHGHFRVQAYQ